MFLAQLEMMVCHPAGLQVQFMKAQDLTESFYILHNVTVNNHVKLTCVTSNSQKFTLTSCLPRSPSPWTVQISRNGSGAASGDPRDAQLH